MRADATSVSLRERVGPATATVRSTQFSTSAGTIEQFGDMYRVTAQNGLAPTGTFAIQFFSGLNLTLLVFDIVMSPSNPEITVQVSVGGTSYASATQVTQTGYRVTAWLPEGEVKYVRIAITPGHPDTLGGSSYTFGLTSFTAYMVEFHMQSEFATMPVQVTPGSDRMRLLADDSDGFIYSLSLGVGSHRVRHRRWGSSTASKILDVGDPSKPLLEISLIVHRKMPMGSLQPQGVRANPVCLRGSARCIGLRCVFFFGAACRKADIYKI